MGSAASVARTFNVALPANWRAAERLVLELRGLRVPANRSGELEVLVVDRDDRETLVATLPFVALARDAPGMSVHESAVVQLPRAVELAKAMRESENHLRIRLRPIDGQGRLIDDLTWEVRELALKIR